MPPADRPRSIPPGLQVQLFRGRVIPGQSDEVTAWMSMLNERLDEAVDTLQRERTALELVFRQRDGADEHLYWVVVRGAGADVESSSHQLDADHLAFDVRCRERGWQTASPELLLMPDAVRDEVLRWCLPPDGESDGPVA